MKRQTLIALLALLVSVPLTRAIQSCLRALGSSGPEPWGTAVVDLLMASLALSCAVALLALLDDRGPRWRMVALLDWRAVLRARRLARSDSRATARAGV